MAVKGFAYQAAAEFLGDQRILHRTAAKAPCLFRQSRAQPAQFGESCPMIRRYPFVRPNDGEAPFPIIFARDEAPDAVAQRVLFGCVVEVHDVTAPERSWR